MLWLLAGAHRAAPLSVQVGGIVGHLCFGPGDLVVEAVDVLPALVFYGDAGPVTEGHGPVAVEAAAGVHRHRQRVDVGTQVVAAAKEVSQGHLHRWCVFTIPVHAQNAVAIGCFGDGYPDVLDHSGARDIRDGGGFSGGQVDVWPHLPALTEHGCRLYGAGVAGLCLRPSTLAAIGVFC